MPTLTEAAPAPAPGVAALHGRPSARERRVRLYDRFGRLLLAATLLVSLAVLAVLLFDVATKALPLLTNRATSFLTGAQSSDPGVYGISQGLRGTFYIAAFTMLFTFPIGIATAVYLEEYAPDNRLTRFIDINIRNLAGVPSVVYGLLGLAVFVRLVGPSTATSTSLLNLTGGRSVVSAGLTIAVLVLPIVIITAAEAIRAVPDSLREGGYGIGGTRWQVTRRLVLPSALPGILTGTILSLSRAIGETAPLIVVGVTTGFLVSNGGFLDRLYGPYTALPAQIYTLARQPQAAFRDELSAGAIVVLLLVTLSANALAIVLRNRYDRQPR
ncbi:MAG TPA: phosphate ABC transporter permease PstA [Egicoccus sp.]|nr:phosphate ABC transporter permease PstA [Egicoccus sp.]HSK22788.1 phosphate ABC transporter permease PstA [Egicoccus sp.]